MRAVRISKGAQLAALSVYAAFVLGVTLVVEGGREVRTNLAPFEDVERLVARVHAGEFLTSRFLYALGGIAGNLFLLFPFGFLAFRYLDAPGRSAPRVHVDVVLSAFVFSAGIEVVQSLLPTRASDVNDVLWNVAGAVLGTAAAHLAREVHFEWDRGEPHV